MKVVQNFHTEKGQSVGEYTIRELLCSALQWKYVFPEDQITLTCTRGTGSQIFRTAKKLLAPDIQIPWELEETVFTKIPYFYDTSRFFNMAVQEENVVAYLDSDCMVFPEVLTVPNWRYARTHLQETEWAGYFKNDYRYELTQDQDYISNYFFKFYREFRDRCGYWNTGFEIVPKKLANYVGTEVVKFQSLVSSLGIAQGNAILETTAGLYPRYLCQKRRVHFVDLNTSHFIHRHAWVGDLLGRTYYGKKEKHLLRLVKECQGIVFSKGFITQQEVIDNAKKKWSRLI